MKTNVQLAKVSIKAQMIDIVRDDDFFDTYMTNQEMGWLDNWTQSPDDKFPIYLSAGAAKFNLTLIVREETDDLGVVKVSCGTEIVSGFGAIPETHINRATALLSAFARVSDLVRNINPCFVSTEDVRTFDIYLVEGKAPISYKLGATVAAGEMRFRVVEDTIAIDAGILQYAAESKRYDGDMWTTETIGNRSHCLATMTEMVKAELSEFVSVA